MTESPARSSPPPPTSSTAINIPQEIISEEEMAFIDAAFADAVMLPGNPSSRPSPDIEDLGRVGGSTSSLVKKRNICSGSFLHQFREKSGLYVTDITATEWCEKQKEFSLHSAGKSKAMKVGIARHRELAEEVIKSVEVPVESEEVFWALKFLNFMVGAKQLISNELTRELPVIGFVEGIWMTGVIDEIRLPQTDSEGCATLVDRKTREHRRPPSEPLRRNGRLQLMCYKYLWDSLVDDKFPEQEFFDSFSLDPDYILSAEFRVNAAKSDFHLETLNDVVRYFRNICRKLPRANNELILRYEFQEDKSLLGEHKFAYNSEWLTGQMKSSLEFWRGEREASYTPIDERWKCNYCNYKPTCPSELQP